MVDPQVCSGHPPGSRYALSAIVGGCASTIKNMGASVRYYSIAEDRAHKIFVDAETGADNIAAALRDTD